MKTMKAIVQHAPLDFTLEQVPIPEPGPLEVLIKIEACGICTGDRTMYFGKAPWPIVDGEIPGHEFVGIVEKLGEGSAEKYDLKIGDRVTAEVQCPCYECAYCKNELYHLCEDESGFIGGGWAEYNLLPEGSLIHKVPHHLDKLEAALTEPLSCGAYAAELGQIKNSDTVVVSGMGIIGLGTLLFVRRYKPKRIIALSATKVSLKIASDYGSDAVINVLEENTAAKIQEMTDGLGCDVYIECSGVASAVQTGLDALKKRGRMVIYGVYPKPGELNLNQISQNKELTIQGGHLSPGCWDMTIQCLADKEFDLKPLISEVFSLEEFDEAINIRSKNPDSIKTILVPNK